MRVNDLRMALSRFEDDVEVFVWDNTNDQGYEITTVYDDEGRPGELGAFIQTGEELPGL
jgi:hypothetical protein